MLARAHGLTKLTPISLRRVKLNAMTLQPAKGDSKQAWRTWAKGVRSELDVQEVSRQVVDHLTSWQAFREGEHILVYLAFGSEIDLEALSDFKKTFYVTRTWKTDQNLTVHRLDEGLETHPYGYAQPAATSPTVDANTIDLALVPGLCFDERGTRLGYGRGYYDRLLPQLRNDVPLVGITADALIVPELPKDSFDIDMTHLATETGVKPL